MKKIKTVIKIIVLIIFIGFIGLQFIPKTLNQSSEILPTDLTKTFEVPTMSKLFWKHLATIVTVTTQSIPGITEFNLLQCFWKDTSRTAKKNWILANSETILKDGKKQNLNQSSAKLGMMRCLCHLIYTSIGTQNFPNRKRNAWRIG